MKSPLFTSISLARKYLSQAKKFLGKKEEFYIALEEALHNYLRAKLHIETSEISKERIVELLNKKGVKPEIIERFIAVLKDCDFARFWMILILRILFTRIFFV